MVVYHGTMQVTELHVANERTSIYRPSHHSFSQTHQVWNYLAHN